jgi:bile acid-coenzyme A ligase
MGAVVGGEVSYGKRLTEIATARPSEANLVIVASDGTETAVTWHTLESRANQIARRLEGLGVEKDSLVCLALPTCVEHITVTLAIWKLGATLLPLRHDQPQWEMDRLLAVAQPLVMVSDTHTATCPVLTRNDLEATTTLPDHPLEDRISEILNLGASSGSTGVPKLIVTPLRGVVNEDPTRQHMAGAGTMVALVTSPLYHVNGFSFVTPELLAGTRVFVMEKFDAALAVELIEKHQITFTVMVPTMLQRIARLPGLRAEQLASINRLIYGGATIPEWLVDRWLELIPPEAFLFTYGSSERLGLMAMTGAEWTAHRGATGRPLDVDVKILDERGDEVATGEIGEVYMRPLDPTRRLFTYVGIPTPQPTADGYLSIGDLGRVDADGYLYIVDRRTDMIVTGGANVFPAEVEAALSQHPDVIDQVVVGVPDEEWGHRVHAILQLRDGTPTLPADELRAWCKTRLSGYKVPKTFEIVDRVPRTPAGKLNRTTLGNERADAT